MKLIFTSVSVLTIALAMGFFHAATPTFLQIEGQIAHHQLTGDHHEPSVANGCQTICQGSPVRSVDSPDEEIQEKDPNPTTPQPIPIYASILQDLRLARQSLGAIWKSSSWVPPDILLLTGTITTGR